MVALRAGASDQHPPLVCAPHPRGRSVLAADEALPVPPVCSPARRVLYERGGGSEWIQRRQRKAMGDRQAEV